MKLTPEGLILSLGLVDGSSNMINNYNRSLDAIIKASKIKDLTKLMLSTSCPLFSKEYDSSASRSKNDDVLVAAEDKLSELSNPCQIIRFKIPA